MADDYLTVADMVSDAYDLSGRELSEVRAAAPLISLLPAVAASNGTQHKYSVMTQLPVTGFRAENVGRSFDHSIDRIDSIDLKILDWSWAVDKAVADAARMGREAMIAREGVRHIASAMWNLEQQYINGTVGAAAGGFDGLADSTNLDALADAHTVNAAGTTATTGSSVYFLRMNPSECAMVYKGDGMPIQLMDTQVQNFTSGSGLNYPAYYTGGCGWFASQLGALYSVVRICNLTEDSGKGLTDDLIFDALELFPAGAGPDVMVMNRRSQEQLRKSRTATNVTGAPAPIVTEVAGIRAVTTDAILNTEALIA
jgi:hypothetical protein